VAWISLPLLGDSLSHTLPTLWHGIGLLSIPSRQPALSRSTFRKVPCYNGVSTIDKN
jgi:hypothetical protein